MEADISRPTRLDKLNSPTGVCSLACYNLLRALSGSSHMRFTAAERRVKLTKLMEIEGYDNFEEMAQAILSDSVSPAILHE
jgi:hypothetical protein